jgi:hypothetical protein
MPYLGNIGNPSKQVKRKAVLLSRFIRNRFEISLYINGIIVFTSEEARLKVLNLTVAVLRPQEICGFIQNYRSTLKNIKLEELKQHSSPILVFHSNTYVQMANNSCVHWCF